LGKFIHERFGIDIPAAVWPVDKLPEHLQMRYSIVDAKGQEVISGRDLRMFQDNVLAAEESIVFNKARKTWEKTGLTQWDFGDLPEEIPVECYGTLQGFAYPGIEAAEGSVNIRLYPTRREADEAHRKGVMMLFTILFQPELKYLKKTLTLSGDMKVWAGVFGGQKTFESRLFEKVRQDLFAVSVRTADAFRQHAEAATSRLLLRGQEILREIKPVVKAYHETIMTLQTLSTANRPNTPGLKFLESLKRDLDLLIPPDFLLRYDAERLRHIVRYLKALMIRAERGLLHLEKDRSKTREIKPFEEILQDSLNNLTPLTSVGKRQTIEDFRWLIEEYKVSLFAQELKTPYPVSKKRLDEKMREIERML
jgi:ATP-dependent helicase HrpA